MAKQAPKVLDGTRGPRADRIDDMRARAEAQPDFAQGAERKAEGTVYLSHFPGYMVQISAPADLVDPLTGRKTIGRPVVARFSDGRYVNNARDPKLRAYIDEEMQRKTRFGKPGSGADYWLADEAVRVARAAAKANATNILKELAKTNREEFNELVASLQQGNDTDGQMPAPPAAPGA